MTDFDTKTVEGRRLAIAFHNISDQAVREALIVLAESYATLSSNAENTTKAPTAILDS